MSERTLSGQRSIGFHARVMDDTKVCAKAPYVCDYGSHSCSAFIVVCEPEHRLARKTKYLQRAQSTRQAQADVLIDDVKPAENGLCLGHGQRPKSVENLLPIMVGHPQEMLFNYISLFQPSVNAGIRIQDLRIEVCQDEVRLSLSFSSGNLLRGRCDAVGSLGHRISLPTQPEHNDSRGRGHQHAQPCVEKSAACQYQPPSAPIDRTRLAHRPALIEAKPPIHSLISLFAGRNSATGVIREVLEHG